jgi:hypothetical protein
MSNAVASAPAIPAPPGHTAFDHSETIWKWMILCITICLAFTTIPFLLRVYVRAYIRKEWLFEDCEYRNILDSLLVNLTIFSQIWPVSLW